LENNQVDHLLGVWCSTVMRHGKRVFGWEHDEWMVESFKLVHIMINAHPRGINNHMPSQKLNMKDITKYQPTADNVGMHQCKKE